MRIISLTRAVDDEIHSNENIEFDNKLKGGSVNKGVHGTNDWKIPYKNDIVRYSQIMILIFLYRLVSSAMNVQQKSHPCFTNDY